MEREEVILILCEITDLEIIIRMLRIILETVEQINNLIQPVKKWLRRMPFLKSVILVLDFTEIILESVIHLLELFESLSRSG
jgi:hypothetical protein